MRNTQNRRSRGRSRKAPNPLTRSYESNGPDVKVRGTAPHVAEKYMTLARDALSAGDTVSAESYLQHAEHYNRIVAAAQQAQFQQAQQGEIQTAKHKTRITDKKKAPRIISRGPLESFWRRISDYDTPRFGPGDKPIPGVAIKAEAKISVFEAGSRLAHGVLIYLIGRAGSSLNVGRTNSHGRE